MFSPEEKKLLEKYVTSSDDDVFAVKGMEGMVGAAYARYSRARGGFREVLLKEFIREGAIDPKHADQLIERILIAYGDDSVGELEGAHVSFENISMLATKEIEDRRIGGSPIEQSTRYVFYDQKMVPAEGGGAQWRYLRGSELLNAPFGKLYEETNDFIFDTYTSLIEPMKDYFGKLLPLEEASYDINGDGAKEHYGDLKEEKDQKAFRTTYTMDTRTKACDCLRALLPLSTLTNVGVFGNGRFFQGLISHLYTSDIPEANRLGDKTFQAAREVIPQYVRRAAKSDYLIQLRTALREAGKSFSDVNPEPVASSRVELAPREDAFTSLLAAALYPYANVALAKLRTRISALPDAEKHKLFEMAVGNRKTRRDRPGRGFEDGYLLTFDLATNWGVYKDLMRHRMNTQQRQLFTTKIGFDIPEHLKTAGLETRARECATRADKLFDEISKRNPVLAQYAVLHGNFTRWTLGMNAREAFHLLELRTTPQGHAQYRRVSQMMHDEITKKYPWLGASMNFVDHNNYESARGDAEARQRVKERTLDEKIGDKNSS
jgi:thymidylate synthase ThyX